MKSSTLLVLYATLMYFFASTRTVQGQLSWTDLTKGGRSFHKKKVEKVALNDDARFQAAYRRKLEATHFAKRRMENARQFPARRFPMMSKP